MHPFSDASRASTGSAHDPRASREEPRRDAPQLLPRRCTSSWKSSVVIRDLYLIREAGVPEKADSVLLVDPDRPLASAICSQIVEIQAAPHPQIIERSRRVKKRKSSARLDEDRAGGSSLLFSSSHFPQYREFPRLDSCGWAHWHYVT